MTRATHRGRGSLALAAAAVLVLAGCERGPPRLMNIRSTTAGPDEFAILPPKPLELPPELAAAAAAPTPDSLPEPTPGGANRTDPTPNADAIAALGGNPGGGAGADAGLIGHVGRYGVAADIRATLAAEDLEFRSNNRGRLLERLFNKNTYFRAYRKQSLDQQAELRKWRARGIRTVSAPPPQRGE